MVCIYIRKNKICNFSNNKSNNYCVDAYEISKYKFNRPFNAFHLTVNYYHLR